MTSSDLPATDPVTPPNAPSLFGRIRAFLSRDDVGKWLFLLTLVAGAVHRGWFIFSANPPKNFVWSDMQGYVDRAARLADPKIKLNPFDAFYPPGTHALLAPFFALTKSRDAALAAGQSLWFVFAVGTLVAVGLIANRLFKHPLAAFIATTLVWTHWAFSVFAGFFSSENPFAFFMCVSLLVALWARDIPTDRRWARTGAFALAGLLAGITASIRPQFVIQAAFMGLPLIGFYSLYGRVRALFRKGADRPKEPWFHFREAIALAVMFLLPCFATMRLNSAAMKKPSGMSNNAGLNFYQAHCDVVHVHMQGMGFAAPVRIQRMINEGRDANKKVVHKRYGWDNEYFFDLGFKCIRKDGWSHARRIYTNVADLFATTEPWPPNQGKFRRVTTISNVVYCYALLFIVPVALWLARRRRPERWLLVQHACVLPVGLLFVGDPRYRIPYDVFGMLLLTGIIMAGLKLRRDERSDAAPAETPAVPDESSPETNDDEQAADEEASSSDEEKPAASAEESSSADSEDNSPASGKTAD